MELRKTSIQNAEHFFWGQNYDGWFLAKNPNASVIQEVMLPGTSEVTHYHEKTWQYIFILTGKMTVEIGKSQCELNPLEGIEMPIGISHNLYNQTTENVTYLLISAPNVEGDRINI